jgi:GntR family transcriptional regulator
MDFTPLDKNSSEQLYLQFRRMIIKTIREQELLPRQRVPSVNELSKATEVSRPATRLISVDTIPAEQVISRHLNLDPNAEVYRVVRVRYADAFPLSVERAYLSCKRFPGLDQLINNAPSLYGILRQAFGVRPVRALQFLEAGEADLQTAELLDLRPGKPVLLSERITYAGSEDPIEYVSGATRPGFVRFKTELVAGWGTTVRQVIMPKV